jgi:hypothetical protein
MHNERRMVRSPVVHTIARSILHWQLERMAVQRPKREEICDEEKKFTKINK